MLSSDTIGAIRALLARVQISGAEVPAFNRIVDALVQEEEHNRRNALAAAQNIAMIKPASTE